MEIEPDFYPYFQMVKDMGYPQQLVLEAQKQMWNPQTQEVFHIIQFIENHRQKLENGIPVSTKPRKPQQQQHQNQAGWTQMQQPLQQNNHNNPQHFQNPYLNSQSQINSNGSNSDYNNWTIHSQNTNLSHSNQQPQKQNQQQNQNSFQQSNNQFRSQPYQNQYHQNNLQQQNANSSFSQQQLQSQMQNQNQNQSQNLQQKMGNLNIQENNNNTGSNNNNENFELDLKKEKISIDFGLKKYELDCREDFVKQNKQLSMVLQNLDGMKKDIQNKLKQKVPEIQKVTDFHQFSSVEYLIWWNLEKEEKRKNKHKIDKDEEECSICMCPLYDLQSEYQNCKDFQKQLQVQNKDDDVIKLAKCEGHFFHVNCFANYLKSNHMDNHTKCPVCQKIYGIMIGKQPPGSMQVSVSKGTHCQGYEKYGTIIINYSFSGGQDSKINNGVRYSGTSRTAYLPDNKEGQEVLALLKKAFDRKLTFIVGTSVTTGQSNTVVWAGIHHKTSTHKSTFGYPDPTYFDRVKEELASRGVY